jgi:hypothetical protein
MQNHCYVPLCFLVTLPALCCARNDPPGASAPAGSHAVHVNAARPIASPPLETTSRTANASRSAAVPAGSTVSATDSAPATTSSATSDAGIGSVTDQQNKSALFDSAGEPLPQTEARPDASSPAFRERIAHLCQAIVGGVPADAHDAFFPLVAYKQVKAVADPERDYRLRLLSHFDRDILEYHHRISRRPGPYRCGELTIPERQARWMKPGSEYNRLGYFRVLRSHLQVVDAADKAISLEVTSLISWRGEWYVVHLNGFE